MIQTLDLSIMFCMFYDCATSVGHLTLFFVLFSLPVPGVGFEPSIFVLLIKCSTSALPLLANCLYFMPFSLSQCQEPLILELQVQYSTAAVVVFAHFPLLSGQAARIKP
jgi:hypothetical protein